MNIYKLSRLSSGGYGSFTTCIVVAESEDKARLIHPNGAIYPSDEYDDSWVKPEDVIVSLIGSVTVPTYKSAVYDWTIKSRKIKDFTMKPNIVLCSYNVGS